MILATKETPILLCRTCGLATHKFHIRHSTNLFQEKRKTWKRLIKPSHRLQIHPRYRIQPWDTAETANRKMRRIKKIYVSYVLMNCIKKRHKLSIRYAPFASCIITKLK